MVRYAITVLLIVTLSVPAFATCNQNCVQEFSDSDGDGNMDTQTARCETVSRGTLLTCDPYVQCWRMGGGAKYCEARCDGSPCYYI